MRSAKSAGRIVGVLLALQLATGLVLPFVLTRSMTGDIHAFVASAAGHAPLTRVAVLIAFAGGALTVGIAVTSWPVFRRASQSMALWFLAVCAISLVMDAIHNASLMSVVSLSKAYAGAGAADSELRAVARLASSIRFWAHYTQLVFVGAWMLTFYSLVLRSALVPRLLAGLGLIGSALQVTGVTLPAFLGYPSMVQLAMPLGPIHLAVAIWLMTRGFDDRRIAA